MNNLTFYKKRQMKLTELEKKQEREIRNIKLKERYKNDVDFKKRTKYISERAAAKRFIKIGNLEDLQIFKKLLDEKLKELKNK